MAIADNSSDISCSVVVDGKPLLAYADDNTKNEDNETTRYVEVATGQSYKIEYSIGPDFETHSYGVAVYLIIDGEEVDKRIHHPQDVEFGHTSTFTNVVYNIGNRYCAATFKFGNVDIVDADLAPTSPGRADQYRPGSISLRFFRVLLLPSQSTGLYVQQRPARGDETIRVSEVAVKGRGVSHGTGYKFDEEESDDEDDDNDDASHTRKQPLVRALVEAEHVPEHIEPFAIFTFEYRSREALDALMITTQTMPDSVQQPTPQTRRQTRQVTPLESLTEEDTFRVSSSPSLEQDEEDTDLSEQPDTTAPDQSSQDAEPSPANERDDESRAQSLPVTQELDNQSGQIAQPPDSDDFTEQEIREAVQVLRRQKRERALSIKPEIKDEVKREIKDENDEASIGSEGRRGKKQKKRGASARKVIDLTD